MPDQPTSYNEFISVYLVQPIARCGNAVCEGGGRDLRERLPSRDVDQELRSTFETLQTQIPPLGDTFPNFADYAMAAVGPDMTPSSSWATHELVDLDGCCCPAAAAPGSW